MHFHVPKPLHGWREFVHEVVIIVLGVLIALGLEQGVERARWARQVHDARTALHREMAFDLAEVADRGRVAACVERHIAEAQRRIDALAATGSVPPGATNLETPGRLILVGDYDAQQAAQNLVHFPPDELSALGLWYDQMRSFREWINVEGGAWVGLSLL